MARGYLVGSAGSGATGSYVSRISPTVDVPPNSSGGYTVTYEFWVFFAGNNAYKVYVNGIEVDPGTGYLNGSATWILESTDIIHDCINGACVPKTTYNTPGLYASLEACQVACGSKGCSGKCISNSEWAEIEGLSNQIRNRNCG
jgi:hypothetical protein